MLNIGSTKYALTCSPCFYRVIETLVKVWENSKKLWKHCGSCSHNISRSAFFSPKFPLVFLLLDRNTAHVFHFLNRWMFATTLSLAGYLKLSTSFHPKKRNFDLAIPWMENFIRRSTNLSSHGCLYLSLEKIYTWWYWLTRQLNSQ